MKYNPVLFTGYFLLFTFHVMANAGQDSKTNQLVNFLDGLDTFSAGFEQVLYNEFDEVLEISTGVVYLMQPGKFHWVYYEPYSQYLISNGTTLWIFDEDLEQVTINDANYALNDSPAGVLSGDVDVDEQFVVVDLGLSDNLDWLELTSRDTESQYGSIRLGFRDKLIQQMVLFDNLGQKTQIIFHDSKRNPDLRHALFEFPLPEGVDVIDNRQSSM